MSGEMNSVNDILQNISSLCSADVYFSAYFYILSWIFHDEMCGEFLICAKSYNNFFDSSWMGKDYISMRESDLQYVNHELHDFVCLILYMMIDGVSLYDEYELVDYYDKSAYCKAIKFKFKRSLYKAELFCSEINVYPFNMEITLI